MAEIALVDAVCARCGAAIDPADHYLIAPIDGDQRVLICRSEHIVAWLLRGGQWSCERPWEVDPEDRAASGGLAVTRVRSGNRIVRDFASPGELQAWASSGGIWGEDGDAC
jgi:hypothetical protein